MSKALESGKSLAEQILAKLPEAVRATVAPVFAAPEAVDALTLLGDSALARSDYSRLADELKQKEDALTEDYTKLNDWYATNRPKLEQFDQIKPEYDRLKAGGAPPPKEPEKPPVAGLTEEKLTEILQQRDQGYARVLSLSNKLSLKHYQDFNEVLDTDALIDHANKHRVSLADAYQQVHAEQLTAKAKAADDARVQKLVDEKLAIERKSQQQPFPVRGAEPSVLDELDKPDRTGRHTVDSAVARYEELVANAGART